MIDNYWVSTNHLSISVTYWKPEFSPSKPITNHSPSRSNRNQTKRSHGNWILSDSPPAGRIKHGSWCVIKSRRDKRGHHFRQWGARSRIRSRPGTEASARLRVDRTPLQAVNTRRHKYSILLRHLNQQRSSICTKGYFAYSTILHTLVSNPQAEPSRTNSCGLAWTPTSSYGLEHACHANAAR
jgi:hypothetical protein